MSKRTGRPVGRPSIYTPELAGEICLRIAAGESLRSICSDKHTPNITTVLEWAFGYREEAKKDGFPQQYARAREMRSELYADECVEIADTETDSARARVRVDTRKWIAGKLLPRTYGDRVKLEHSTTEPLVFTLDIGGRGGSDDATDGADDAE